jgi:hypothetical protein
MAKIPISQFPVAITIDGTEDVPIVQGGTDKRATTGQIGRVGLTSAIPASLEWTIDGTGATINSRIWGTLTVPFDATISGATLQGDQTGSISIDIWKCTYSEYDPPTTPTVANSICGGAPPAISSAKKATATITNWTTSLDEGDILTFYVPSASTGITRVTLNIDLVRVVS